jgi:hypothetical protein
LAAPEQGSIQLGSILVGSPDPRRLKAWYLEALAPAEDQYGFLDFGGSSVLIDTRDDVSAANPEPGRFVLNFHVADAKATAEHLTGMGVTWLVEVEQRKDGLFGTLLDPDGNYVQIIQLSERYLESRR